MLYLLRFFRSDKSSYIRYIIIVCLGQLTELKFPYPRVVDEPNMYDTILVQAESIATEDLTREPDFSVCILEIQRYELYLWKNSFIFEWKCVG